MPDYSTRTDQQLLALLQEGDEAAFTAIYNRYWAIMYNHGCHMLKDTDAAMDLVQDVFMDLWQKGNEVAVHASLKAYLYGAVRYKTMDTLRKSQVRDKYVQSMIAFSVQGEYSTDDAVNLHELVQRLEAALDQMPAQMRKIFELSRMEGQTPNEIADQLGLSVSAVHKTLSRAVRLLRSKLGVLFF